MPDDRARFQQGGPAHQKSPVIGSLSKPSEPASHSRAGVPAEDGTREVVARSSIAAQKLTRTRIALREANLIVDVLDIDVQADLTVHVETEGRIEDTIAWQRDAV